MHQSDFNNITSYLRWAKKEVEPYIVTNKLKLRDEHKSFLMYGFIAETGLLPSACQLIERHTADDIIWIFEPKDELDHVLQEALRERDAEITLLRERLQHAQQQIARLKGI